MAMDEETGMAMVHPEDLPAMRAAVARLEETGRAEAQYRQRAKSGEYRWLSNWMALTRTSDGKPLYRDGSIRDITEQRRAETALRESESVLRSFFNSPGGMRGVIEVVADDDVRHVADSVETARFLGLTPEAMWGELGSELGESPEILHLWVSRYRESESSGRPVLFEYVEKRGRGEAYLWATVSYIGAPEGKPRFPYIVHDVTERKRAQEALRESERREHARAAEFAALMEAAPVGIFVSPDTECRWMSGNRAAYDLLGRPQGSNLSKSGPEGEKPVNFRALKDGKEIGKEIPLAQLPMRRVAATGQAMRDQEMDFIFEDGVTVNVLGNIAPLLDESGRPRGAVGVYLDITERKRAQGALRESEAKCRGLFNSIQEMGTVYEVERDDHGRIVERRLLDANPAFLRTVGASSVDELRGKTSSEVFGADWSAAHRDAIQQAMESGKTLTQEVHRPRERPRLYQHRRPT